MEDNQVGRTAARIMASMSRRGALRRLGAGSLAAGAAIGSYQRVGAVRDFRRDHGPHGARLRRSTVRSPSAT